MEPLLEGEITSGLGRFLAQVAEYYSYSHATAARRAITSGQILGVRSEFGAFYWEGYQSGYVQGRLKGGETKVSLPAGTLGIVGIQVLSGNCSDQPYVKFTSNFSNLPYIKSFRGGDYARAIVCNEPCSSSILVRLNIKIEADPPQTRGEPKLGL